jgi:hypothetical protein
MRSSLQDTEQQQQQQHQQQLQQHEGRDANDSADGASSSKVKARFSLALRAALQHCLSKAGTNALLRIPTTIPE